MADTADGDLFVEFAPAKVNLYLHVIGRRPDGYHLLDSLVCFATVGDRLLLRQSSEPLLTLVGPFAEQVPADHDNLVMRAVFAASAAFELPPKISVHLDKQLPVAAGIGGGSADAAAVLRGLCRLWGESATDPRWLQIAARLGADVPVCLAGRPMRIVGVGDRIEPVPTLLDLPAILVNPRVPVLTPPVFNARTGPFSVAQPSPQLVSSVDALIAELASRRNDLTAPALRLHPQIGGVLQALGALPGCALARMSGSGGTCFGLFASQSEARAGADWLACTYPHWWVADTTLLLAHQPGA